MNFSPFLAQQSCSLVLGGHVNVGEYGKLHSTILDPKNVGLHLLAEVLGIGNARRSRLIWLLIPLTGRTNVGSSNLDHSLTGIAALQQLNKRLCWMAKISAKLLHNT